MAQDGVSLHQAQNTRIVPKTENFHGYLDSDRGQTSLYDCYWAKAWLIFYKVSKYEDFEPSLMITRFTLQHFENCVRGMDVWLKGRNDFSKVS